MDGNTRLLERLALAAAAAFLSVNIWTGAPLLALWVGSRTAPASGLSMTSLFVVVLVLLATVIGLVALLARLTARYDRISGRPEGGRRVSPWLRSMRGERDALTHQRQRGGAIEQVVVASVTVAVLAFNVWFFFFAGSPLGNG
jgi:hypothetical protein